MKTQSDILAKLGIEKLNPMQEEARKAILKNPEVVLLSPTGTGKTLAFLLPIIEELKKKTEQVQAMVIVPSRELAIQIEQVLRQMGSGWKVNAFYGGRAGAQDRAELKTPPAILIGTPGRIADHFRRKNINTDYVRTLVLDEFDKSLEVGFDDEMKTIIDGLPNLQKKILTSATQGIEIPKFLSLEDALTINYLGSHSSKLSLRSVASPDKDKLSTLRALVANTREGSGIVFCNFKATIDFVSDYFDEHDIEHSLFHGGMEQIDRERALVQFRNGTHRVLLATDLAARGIDVPELDYIIHYQMPAREPEFTHRNGRTARMHASGTAYLMHWEKAPLPDFVEGAIPLELSKKVPAINPSKWDTIHVSGGRKDKISKGDLAGLFFKQGGLEKGELGVIELGSQHSYVAVPRAKSLALVKKLNNQKVKGRKVRVSVID